MLTMLTLDSVMNAILRVKNNDIPAMKLMLDLGTAVETEAYLRLLKESKDRSVLNAKKMLKDNTLKSLRTYVRIKRILKDQQEWPMEIKVKIRIIFEYVSI